MQIAPQSQIGHWAQNWAQNVQKISTLRQKLHIDAQKRAGVHVHDPKMGVLIPKSGTHGGRNALHVQKSAGVHCKIGHWAKNWAQNVSQNSTMRHKMQIEAQKLLLEQYMT
jgi:hypothetical protein